MLLRNGTGSDVVIVEGWLERLLATYTVGQGRRRLHLELGMLESCLIYWLLPLDLGKRRIEVRFWQASIVRGGEDRRVLLRRRR